MSELRLTGDYTASGGAVITRLQAVDQMIQLLASPMPSTQEALPLLADCQLCRNHLLYLLDTLTDSADNRRMVQARLRALPLTHEGHGRPGHPDQNKPRVRTR